MESTYLYEIYQYWLISQILNILYCFAILQKSTQNVPSQPQGSKLTKRPVYNKPQTTQASGKKSASAQLAASKREAQRKQLMELKRKNKMALNQEVGNETNGGDVEQKMQQDDTIEIFCAAPSTSS